MTVLTWIRRWFRPPYRRIDENALAVQITARESGARQVDIAQTKEQLAITLDLLHDIRRDNPKGFRKLIDRHAPPTNP